MPSTFGMIDVVSTLQEEPKAMSAIQNVSSILGDVYTSGTQIRSLKGSHTIADIRDQVDQMAMSGQLTTAQQRLLIGDGLQDMNASDKSYQPAGQLGYSRSDNESINLVNMLQSFGQATGDARAATTYQSLVDLFSNNESSSSNFSM